jgi:hypothetical protein
MPKKTPALPAKRARAGELLQRLQKYFLLIADNLKKL